MVSASQQLSEPAASMIKVKQSFTKQFEVDASADYTVVFIKKSSKQIQNETQTQSQSQAIVQEISKHEYWGNIQNQKKKKQRTKPEKQKQNIKAWQVRWRHNEHDKEASSKLWLCSVCVMKNRNA